MIDNVIFLNRHAHSNAGIAAMAEDEAPMGLVIPACLARTIKISARMHCKEPAEFVLSWLQSGFPGEAA